MQVFDYEPVVGLDQPVGDLMQKMATNIGDPVMVARQPGGGLGPVT